MRYDLTFLDVPNITDYLLFRQVRCSRKIPKSVLQTSHKT
jgi:hypothetical protein